MFELLGVPFFTFHDRDIAPEGATLAESNRNVREIADIFARKMESAKTRLLWGTANLFSNRRFMAGAATNPEPGRLRLRRRAGEERARRDARARRRELRSVGRARRLRDAPQHRHEARARPVRPLPDHGRRAQGEDRLQGHDPHRAEAEGADQAPVRLRRRQHLRHAQGLRPGQEGQDQHRAEPRHPRRPLLRARDPARRRARHLRLARPQPRRQSARLGHRPVRHECRRS